MGPGSALACARLSGTTLNIELQHKGVGSHPRGTECPSHASFCGPRRDEGAGNAGCRCTRSLVCEKCAKNAHEKSTGTTEHTPAFPAQWFTTYTRSPRSAGLVSLRRLAHHQERSLTPASGRQDHAISPSASHAVRPTAATRPSHSASRFVTIGRNVPHLEAGWRQSITVFRKTEDKYFSSRGLTSLPIIRSHRR